MRGPPTEHLSHNCSSYIGGIKVRREGLPRENSRAFQPAYSIGGPLPHVGIGLRPGLPFMSLTRFGTLSKGLEPVVANPAGSNIGVSLHAPWRTFGARNQDELSPSTIRFVSSACMGRDTWDALFSGLEYSWRSREGECMKILVVDDHALIREALRGVLKQLKNDAVVLEASDSREAMSIVAGHADIGLILLDLGLPDSDGFSTLAQLRERHPAISVVVLSAQQDRSSVVKALDLGALGFIPKSVQRDVMLTALQLIFAGGIYIPPEILAREEPPLPDSQLQGRTAASLRGSPRDLGLTERQLEVLGLMTQGKSNKAICRVLKLAEPTVKNHVTAIFRALKVTNRTEAVIAVIESGWKLPLAS
jgi:DNA-binding NarL/FixJ family response regulator